jgi:hypothetical protein
MAQITTIGIDQNNDIYLDGYNNIAMKDDIQALNDIILNKVRTNLGELQFNSNLGIPYFTTIFSSVSDIDLWQKFVVDSALSTPYIEKVSNFEHEISNNNKLSYSMTIITDLGSMTVNG